MRKLSKRTAVMVLLVLVCFLLQSTVFRYIRFASVGPNLFVILTSSMGFMRGSKSGMKTGVLCGFFADLFWGNVFGLFMMVYTILGFLAGSFQKLYYREDIKLLLFLVAALDFLYGVLIFIGLYTLQGHFDYTDHLFQIVLPEMVYTVLVAIFTYQPILTLNRLLEEEEQRSESKFV